MRTLTETLMEEEANHSSNLCYKTASSYMFGAEAWDSNFGCDIPTFTEIMNSRDAPSSSSCGSALSSGSGFGSARSIGSMGSGFDLGRAPNSIKEHVCGLEFQYWAGEHEQFGRDHVNIDVVNPTDNRSFLQKIHINWKK